ncbi:MAG: membrane dipeptidase [Elusimicrobia bacterium]|nr:membrane dipeptidase [Elusimicrobiota bacterium]
MSDRGRRLAWAFGPLVALGVPLALRAIGSAVDARLHRVFESRPAVPAPPGLPYADLHADPLLWDRDLLAEGRRGHVDLPRLLRGGVGLQVFSVVASAPLGINIHRNRSAAPDLVTLLQVAQWRAPAVWFSRKARALDRARRLSQAARDSGGRLVLVRAKDELEAALAAAPQARPVAALLSLEGASALEGSPENVAVLHEAGFRVLSFSHFTDTEFGGSAHGQDKGGLTAAGRAALGEMARLGMVLDLAHASPRLFDEALSAWKGPVLVSHTGVRGTCDNPRNLTDAQLRAVARRGGLIGVGFWPHAVCGRDSASAVRAILHAVRVAGADSVALGSDFDGAVGQPFDATGLPRLAAELALAGLPAPAVVAVMGGNARRFFLRSL